MIRLQDELNDKYDNLSDLSRDFLKEYYFDDTAVLIDENENELIKNIFIYANHNEEKIKVLKEEIFNYYKLLKQAF